MGKKKIEANPFKDLIELFIDLKRTQLGETPKAILDTMDELYRDKRNRPLLIKNGAKPYAEGDGWHFVFTLNPGCNYYEVEKNIGYFQSVIDGKVEMKLHGKFLHINVSNFEWGNYDFDLLTPKLFKEHCSKMYIPIPVGIEPSGKNGKIKFVDMEKFSHLLLAGVNTSGKSTWLKILILFLKKYRPDIRIIYIDFMRLDAAPFKNIVHLGRDISDAHFLLELALLEVERRLDILEGKCSKASQYTGKHSMSPILIAIDELAELEDRESQVMLRKLSMTSRKLGIHLIASLQRPSHTTYKDFTDSRSQFSARMCFHMAERKDSEIVLGNGKAHDIKGIQGRAIWQYGKDEKEVQGLNISDNDLRYVISQLEKGGTTIEEQKPHLWLLPR